MMRGTTDLDYTWYGVLVTDCDALLVLEKCLRGELAHIPRRPHDSERARLIKSGSIFVYESNASGIKRWTDGINWSPSRILTNFLVYHELEKAPPPGEKKRAIKRKRSDVDFDEIDLKASQRASLDEEWTDDDRRLMGSPQDNYGWKVGGLVKKTYSFDFRGASHHIISYFNPDEVRSGELKRPIHCREFQETFIRSELVEQGTRSRNPVTEAQIEQQRWERPLYANDSSVSLMRQYPLQPQAPFVHPTPPVDYGANRPQIGQYYHGPIHRSSVHFPVENSLFTATPAPTYQPLSRPQLHARQSSMSEPAGDGFHRGLSRNQLVRSGVGPMSSGSGETLANSALHHVRSHSGQLESPPEAKRASIYHENEVQDPTYSSIGSQKTTYAVTTPPSVMPTLDTSYSHSIARPVLYQGPHSATDLHSPADLGAAPNQPPPKRGRIESPYQSFPSVHWERTMSAPGASGAATPGHTQYISHVSVEPYSFAEESGVFSSSRNAAYSSTQDQEVYGEPGAAYSISQPQTIFHPPAFSSYSQLTAPS